MSRLVIAEKPSVGKSIAAVLGANKRQDGFCEGNGYIVSWCVGFLSELSEPEAYNTDYGKWRYEDLPIEPEHWQHTVMRDKKKQLDLLKKLADRSDVTEIVNACDAGREGESIFRNAYNLIGCRKPILRLWISSMEDNAIRKGFDELRPGSEYDNLYAAADCRAKADWLVGINGTRLFSVLYHRTLNVGRVLSPTLALVVQREAEIEAFKPEPFYTVNLSLNGFTAVSDKFKDKTEAEKLKSACEKQSASVLRVEKKDKSEKAPALYDLTTLQRDANRILGYTAQQTLDYMQSLYEKKLCTYPRTDSRYLTDDMENTVPKTVMLSAALCGLTAPEQIQSAQICNSKKVSDHHAIIPTISAENVNPDELPAGEREILKLVAKRVVVAVCKPFRYTETTAEISCGGAVFTAKGRQITEAGWKQYEKHDEDEPAELPEISEGMRLNVDGEEIHEGKTTAPKRYTEAICCERGIRNRP